MLSTANQSFQVLIKNNVVFQLKTWFVWKIVTFQMKFLEPKNVFVIDDAYQTDCKHLRERIYITQSRKWWVVVDAMGFLWLLWLRFRTHGGVVVCKKVVMMTFDDENEAFVIFFSFKWTFSFKQKKERVILSLSLKKKTKKLLVQQDAREQKVGLLFLPFCNSFCLFRSQKLFLENKTKGKVFVLFFFCWQEVFFSVLNPMCFFFVFLFQ